MPIIIIIIIAIYIILISWIWQSMRDIDRTKKVVFIAIGIFVVFLITLIIFNISKTGINYQNDDSKKVVRNILVSVFTGINSLIIMPYISKLLNKVHENEIEKETFSKRVVIILIVFLICMFFECGYLKDTQEGILKIYNSSSQKGY
ncbi:MAG: hypothetical protein HFJ40_02885 [Clostridia bacterium]|nr:hypothetical protein [Clostridia bacterium]